MSGQQRQPSEAGGKVLASFSRSSVHLPILVQLRCNVRSVPAVFTGGRLLAQTSSVTIQAVILLQPSHHLPVCDDKSSRVA